MNRYADQEYANGVYSGYVAARDIKYATFRARLDQLQIAQLPGGRLLDVGCGCGYMIDVALERGLDAYGVEFSSTAIASASLAARPRITQGNVNDLATMSAEGFDLITALDVLEHTLDPLHFLTSLRHLLRPGGALVVTTPDTGHFLRPLLGTHWPMLQPLQHTVLFSRQSLRHAIQRCGFEIIRMMSAYKTLTADYLIDQIRIHMPAVAAIYDRCAGLMPDAFRRHPISLNIGEIMVVARTGHGAD